MLCRCWLIAIPFSSTDTSPVFRSRLSMFGTLPAPCTTISASNMCSSLFPARTNSPSGPSSTDLTGMFVRISIPDALRAFTRISTKNGSKFFNTRSLLCKIVTVAPALAATCANSKEMIPPPMKTIRLGMASIARNSSLELTNLSPGMPSLRGAAPVAMPMNRAASVSSPTCRVFLPRNRA